MGHRRWALSLAGWQGGIARFRKMVPCSCRVSSMSMTNVNWMLFVDATVDPVTVEGRREPALLGLSTKQRTTPFLASGRATRPAGQGT